MRKFRNSLSNFGLVVLAGLALTLASSFDVRPSDRLGEYGNMCGSKSDQPYFIPREAAGLPLLYLYDRTGVSVEHSVRFGEDELNVPNFGANLIFLSLISFAFLFQAKKFLGRVKKGIEHDRFHRAATRRPLPARFDGAAGRA
jgi:hypothetical protein